VSTHKDDTKSRIKAVTQSLLNDHIMVAVVTSDLDAYISRLQQTLDEVSFVDVLICKISHVESTLLLG